MSTTITHNATSLYPLDVLEYATTRTHGNTVHSILNRADPDVTFRQAGLREGTLTLLVASHADALAMEDLHADVGTFTLTNTEYSGTGMTYVPFGDLGVTFDAATRTWQVTVGFQEVAT